MNLPPPTYYPPNVKSLSIAWFKKEDWQRWCAIDPDFQPDYQHWLSRAEGAFKQYEDLGKHVLKVIIEPDEFLEWSRINGGKVNGQARSAFAAFKTKQKDSGQ